jgi:hypothetical protein
MVMEYALGSQLMYHGLQIPVGSVYFYAAVWSLVQCLGTERRQSNGSHRRGVRHRCVRVLEKHGNAHSG